MTHPLFRAVAPLALAQALLFVAGCGNDKPRDTAGGSSGAARSDPAKTDPAAEAAALDQGPRARETMSLIAPLAATGEILFDAKGCTGCHEAGSSENAPDLRDVAARRTEAWLRRQVADPEWMAEHDPLTKAMVEQYGVPMADLDLSGDEVTALLQYLLRENGNR